MTNLGKSKELLQYLKTIYKDECPSLKDDERKIWFKAGQVEVVKSIERLLEEDEGNGLRS